MLLGRLCVFPYIGRYSIPFYRSTSIDYPTAHHLMHLEFECLSLTEKTTHSLPCGLFVLVTSNPRDLLIVGNNEHRSDCGLYRTGTSLSLFNYLDCS